MLENLDIFRTARAMAEHAGTRQAVVAQNIANADTPGYRARDVAPFRDVFDASAPSTQMAVTRAGHLRGNATFAQAQVHFRQGDPSAPNGNSVSLELEMLNAVEVKRQHDRAITIYKSALNVLRSSLGRV